MLDYVGVCHLMEARRGANIRVLSTWGKGLEAVGLWYDQLLAESLGKDGQGALPLTWSTPATCTPAASNTSKAAATS